MKDLNESQLQSIDGGNVLESIMFALGYTFGTMAKQQANFSIGDYAMMCM